MLKILGIEGEDRRTAGRLYLAVVKDVLLFGSETWVVTPWLEKALAGFHHQAVWRMVGMVTKRQLDSTWVYPTIGEALVTIRLDYIGVYIARLQNTVAQYIVTCPVMDLCLAAERRLGMRLLQRCWEHPNIYILGIKARHASEEMGETTGKEELEVERE